MRAHMHYQEHHGTTKQHQQSLTTTRSPPAANSLPRRLRRRRRRRSNRSGSSSNGQRSGGSSSSSIIHIHSGRLLMRRLASGLAVMMLVWTLVVCFCQQQSLLFRHQQWRNLLFASSSLVIGGTNVMVTNSRTSRQQQILPWKNRYNLVHVVQTRFMQFQPHLMELGRARLRLFQAITLPSVVQQSTTQFVWIIRTDPDLALELRKQLVAAVAPYDNILLVASNRNPEGFKTDDCIADIIMPLSSHQRQEQKFNNSTSTTLWSGRYETLLSYHEAAQTHTILETRLDADDALLLDYLALVQADAAQRLATTTANTRNNNHAPSWMVWCAKKHMEWQYASPWASTTMSTSNTGALVGLQTRHCVTAGLTTGYTAGTDRNDLPVHHQHQQIHEFIPPCGRPYQQQPLQPLAGDAYSSVYHEQQEAPPLDDYYYNHEPATNCLVRVDPANQFPVALRARCPTSAGMEHVFLTGGLAVDDDNSAAQLTQPFRRSKWQFSQPELFAQLPFLFGIQSAELVAVRAYLQDHLAAVVADALAGQCTKGHSCKAESKDLLKKLLRKVEASSSISSSSGNVTTLID